MMTMKDLVGSAAPIGRRRLLGAGAALVAAPAFAAAASGGAGPLADTTTGRVRGYHNGAIKVFKGVPYGAPTGGTGRWRAPRKPAAWTGVRDATQYGDRSPQGSGPFFFMAEEQIMLGYETMSEDCLSLNVWTPSVGPNSGRRPVMVWLHGGGFAGGSGSSVTFDGTRLATKHDVVIVTINHRLNAFGYLYLAQLNPAYADSGNAGMLDCIAALEWVRDNIGGFGGDPGRVTIFGQSGGAGKVSTLMAMPAAKGLFHRAIAESGSAIRVATPDQATAATNTLLKALGVGPTEMDKLLAAPAYTLVAAQASAPYGLRPVVDGKNLLAHPFDPQGSPLSADVPMIMGYNETEVTFAQGYQLDPIDDGRLRALVKEQTRIAGDADVDRLIALYRADYPGRENTWLLQTLASDWGTGDLVQQQLLRKAAQNAAPAYLYHFTKRTPVHSGKLNTPHCLEMPYVFDNLELARPVTGGPSPDRQAVADKMGALWTSFARTGVPSAPGVPAWRPFNAQTQARMIIGDQFRVVDDPHRAARTAIAQLKAALPAA